MTEHVPQAEITDTEGETLARESRTARAVDVALARDLRYGEPRGVTSSAGYFRDLSGRPHLSPEAERQLVVSAQQGDLRAREQLVEAHLPQIAGVARVYRSSTSLTRVELMQEGVVGLLRALERFDPAREVPFWGYAAWWVRQSMQQLVGEIARPLMLSDRTLRQLAQVKRAYGDHLQRYGREPSGEQLMSDTGLSHAQLGDLLTLESVPRSLDEPVPGPDGDLGAFGELLVDPLAEDAYEQLLDASEIEQVRALLASLNDRERFILRSHFGLDGAEQSLRQIGERLGLSAERVRKIEERALGKLRSAAS
jgi:RNA polymerase sigma factor (sigma-70 family)